MKMRTTSFFVLVAFAFCSSYSSSLVVSNDAAHPDLITRPIPGLNTPLRSKHYSGFLDAGKGKKFHYWFVESERDPINDPVVLWLNGGPGCSSLLGFLTEQGPFWVNKNDKNTLSENEFRWNKIANMIFLESPAGVGFSHRTDNGSLDTNDDTTADDNHAAIIHFFKKFPQFKKNRFYVTGESYGGIYVPTLSVRILTKSPDINFKGFAVGNGVLDWKMNKNSLIIFSYFHGVIGKKLWEPLVLSCCSGSKKNEQLINPLLPGGCDFHRSKDLSCQTAVKNAYEAINSKRINKYNLYQDCEGLNDDTNLLAHWVRNPREEIDRRIMSKIMGLNNSASVNFASPPCLDQSFVEDYMNRKDVRLALNIPDNIPKWEVCNEYLNNNFGETYKTVKPQVTELLKAGKRGLIYHGDVDIAGNFMGGEWFVDDLGFQVTEERREWLVNHQVAGWIKQLGNLTFATVKGAGHMVPTDKPEAAFVLFNQFLEKSAQPL